MIQDSRGINLSIIIPHYNSTELLEGLVNSIPEREDVEILLIDDNSTENPGRLKKIAESRPGQIRLFYNEPGKNSAGACRNIGLEQAKGEWLLFADADDYFLQGFYEKVAVFFESKFDLVWFVPTSWNLSENRITNRHVRYENLVREYLEHGGEREEIRLRYLEEPPWSKLIRRQLVIENDIRFDTTMVANDVMFSARIAYAAGEIGASDEIIYCITKQKGTLTTDVNPQKFFVRVDVFLDKYHFLKKRLSREQWIILDLLGRPYLKLAKKYGLNKIQIFRLYFYLLIKGVRIDISRRWNLRYIMQKLNEHRNYRRS